MKIWRMRILYWITKATHIHTHTHTHTHTHNVILFALSLQQWLPESHTYIFCLVEVYRVFNSNEVSVVHGVDSLNSGSLCHNTVLSGR
jgi:hypothetical protein